MITRRKPLRRSSKPIARGAPPARRAHVKRKRSTPRRSERVLDSEYRAFVRSLPCIFAMAAAATGEPSGCSSWPVEADHAGRRPKSRKANDDTCIPLCGGPGGHHEQRTAKSGAFKGITRDDMRTWLDIHIQLTRGLYELSKKALEPRDEEKVPW